ncbi:MAG: acyltransferase family protein [Dysgonomonas sp.]
MEILSKYRTQLMGFTIILLMFFHIPEGWFIYYFPFNAIYKYAYIGSDIFFLVSGIGIYFAFHKENLKQFYYRRFLRIIPYYYPVYIVMSLILLYIGEIDTTKFILRIYLLDYWITGDIQGWYTSVALFFYLITPLLIPYIKKNVWKTVCITFILCYIIGLFLYHDNFFMLTCRMTQYVLGLAIGCLIASKKNLKLKYLIISSCVGVLIIVANWLFGRSEYEYLAYYTHYMPFFFLCLPTCLLITYTFSLLKNYSFPVLTFMGIHTLNIYIFHQPILHLFRLYFDNKYLIIIMSAIVTILCAYIWRKIVKQIIIRLLPKEI